MRCCGGIFDWDTAPARLAELNKRAEDPNLWSNPQAAQKVMRQRQALERSINAYMKLERDLDDAVTLIELGEAEEDDATVAEGEAALRKLAAEARRQEVEALLSGEADGNDTYLEVHAGAGGTESQDWAEMLTRMYIRWAEERGYKVSLVEASAGEEAGIKSATLQIKGENAYGWMKTELGVHRLVRISPYDCNARRHTSFASVWVYPVVDENIEIEIKRERLPHRHLPRLRCRRPARQHHRLGGAHHPHPHQHRGGEPAGALADQEPRHRLGHAEVAPLRG